MHNRPFKKDSEATKAAKFKSKYSYVSRQLHAGTDHACVYLAGGDCEIRRMEIFERDGHCCVKCGKQVPWAGPVTVRGHVMHGGNTKVSRCWCFENLTLGCFNCHFGKEGHNREVQLKWVGEFQEAS